LSLSAQWLVTGFDRLAKTNFSPARRRTLFSFKIPIHDFHEQNNLFHLNSIRCKDRHQCYYYLYRRRSTTKTEVFSSRRNSHRTSELTAEKHSFLSKCQFMISCEHNNSFHHNLFPSCKHRHRYYIGIIQIFELLRYDHLCCTIDCYYSFSLHDMISFVVIFTSPCSLGSFALSCLYFCLCVLIY